MSIGAIVSIIFLALAFLGCVTGSIFSFKDKKFIPFGICIGCSVGFLAVLILVTIWGLK